jgi:hypothetical protein
MEWNEKDKIGKTMNDRDLLKLISWARYLYWCELAYRRWDAYMSEHGSNPDIPEWLAINAHWYASLYVVVEGWEACDFKDQIIDRLLLHPAGYKDLLRKFRNSVFHYQPSLTEARMGAFVSSDLMWAFTLHDEFRRFFRGWVDCNAIGDEASQIRDSITAMVGWIPSRHAEEQINQLEERL